MSQQHEMRSAGPQHAGPAAGAPRRIPAVEATRRASDQLAGLLGTEPERAIGVQATDGGWRVRLEVLELERVPETMSVLASYDVDVGSDGDLTAYRRTRRYARGQIEGG